MLVERDFRGRPHRSSRAHSEATEHINRGTPRWVEHQTSAGEQTLHWALNQSLDESLQDRAEILQQPAIRQGSQIEEEPSPASISLETLRNKPNMGLRHENQNMRRPWLDYGTSLEVELGSPPEARSTGKQS